MAIYRLYPSKDATLYTKQVDMNTGRDAMLEIGSNKLGEAMRAVLQFDDTEITSTIDDTIGSLNFSASLKLYVANAENLGQDTSVHVHPLAQGWVEGVGHYLDAPYNAVGVSWKYRDGSIPWDTSTYSSIHPGGESVGGGVWINSVNGVILSSSYDHVYKGTVDIEANITNFVSASYNGDIANNGLVLRLNIDEFSTGSLSYMQCFSSDTNTIYYPYLEFQWDDSTYSTTLTSITGSLPAEVIIKDVRESYADTSRVRFRIHARPKYPAKVFRTTNRNLDNYRLPQTSYWGIKDEATGEMVIDFNTFATKISTDATSSYFDVYMDNLFVERYYRVVIKTTLDGTTHIIESEKPFKLETNG